MELRTKEGAYDIARNMEPRHAERNGTTGTINVEGN
jgi:hypothetical protein